MRMIRSMRLLPALFLSVLAMGVTCLAQTPATVPATAAATQSAESVLENLLHSPPSSPVISTGTPSTNPAVTPAGEAAAPNAPNVMRMREGQVIFDRVGRLVKDDKADGWTFAFESDGKGMQDPPITLLPSRLLMSMEQVTENGTKPVKFKVSGQVTEYHGKNFLLLEQIQTVRDLNQF